MVRVELYRRRKDQALAGFRARGHSGYAAHGEDIVCAAISALTTVIVLGLEQRLGLEPSVVVDEASGFLSCELDLDALDDSIRVRSQDLLETLSLGLHEIEKEYPKHLIVKEVAL